MLQDILDILKNSIQTLNLPFIQCCIWILF